MREYGRQGVYDKKRFSSVHDGAPDKKSVYTISLVSAESVHNCIGSESEKCGNFCVKRLNYLGFRI